jgi:dolichyl-phosphate-mannose--protein O-mannosyl transferase
MIQGTRGIQTCRWEEYSIEVYAFTLGRYSWIYIIHLLCCIFLVLVCVLVQVCE